MIWTFWPKLIDKFVEHDLDEYAAYCMLSVFLVVRKTSAVLRQEPLLINIKIARARLGLCSEI